MYVIILADDIGEKLWPLTSEEIPKAFLKVYSEATLLEETILRVAPFLGENEFDKIFIVLLEKSVEFLLEQETLDIFGIPIENLLTVPSYRGSTWSILTACTELKKRGVLATEPVLVLSADQFMWPREGMTVQLLNLSKLTNEFSSNELIVFGLAPGGPSPSLNYMTGDWNSVKSTGLPVESAMLNTLLLPLTDYKVTPDYELAQSLVNSNWVWDLGTYLASLSKLTDAIHTVAGKTAGDWDSLTKSDFSRDVLFSLITQHHDLTVKSAVIPRILWSLVDNWVSIKYLMQDTGLFPETEQPEVNQVEASNNLVIKPNGKNVVLFGVSDLIIIDTGDKLLVGTPEGLYDNF